MAYFRKGPLPPPEELEKYEALLPGATKMLFDNLISQTNHRMELEKREREGKNPKNKVLPPPVRNTRQK
jgi:uncharacterized membrane protein